MVEHALERYVAEPNTGCWLWLGPTNPLGYGLVEKKKYGEQLVHRLFYRTHRGEIPERKLVLHRCDTPSCVNPDHLYCGTNADNSRDKVARGRCSREGAKVIFIEHDGLRLCVTDWERRLGWLPDTAAKRIRRGWRPLKAITTPLRRRAR